MLNVKTFAPFAAAAFFSPLLAISLVSSPPPAAAQRQETTTLADALAAAYLENPTLQAQRLALRAENETLPLAKAGFLPSLSAGGSVAHSDQEQEFGPLTTEQKLFSKTYSVSIQQPLFSGFKTLNAVRQARSQIESARANLRLTEQNVLLSAVTAYMNVLRDRAIVDLRKKNIEVLNRENEASLVRLRVGEATRTDVAQSKARLSRARSAYAQSQGNYNESRAAFRQIIGFDPENLGDAGDVKALLPADGLLPGDKDDAVRLAEIDHPLIALSKAAERSSKHNIEIARSALLPKLDLSGSYGRQYETTAKDSEAEQLQIQLQLQIPIYSGGASYAQIRQAKELNSRDRIRIAETHRMVRKNAAASWHLHNAAASRIQPDLDQIEANEIALSGVSEENKLGLRTTLDLLDAEQELLDARVALISTQRDLVVTSYSLLSAVGALSAEALKLPVALYDDRSHYEKTKRRFFGLRANPPFDANAPTDADALDDG